MIREGTCDLMIILTWVEAWCYMIFGGGIAISVRRCMQWICTWVWLFTGVGSWREVGGGRRAQTCRWRPQDQPVQEGTAQTQGWCKQNHHVHWQVYLPSNLLCLFSAAVSCSTHLLPHCLCLCVSAAMTWFCYQGWIRYWSTFYILKPVWCFLLRAFAGLMRGWHPSTHLSSGGNGIWILEVWCLYLHSHMCLVVYLLLNCGKFVPVHTVFCQWAFCAFLVFLCWLHSPVESEIHWLWLEYDSTTAWKSSASCKTKYSMLFITAVCDVHFIKISAMGLWLGQHGILDEICIVMWFRKCYQCVHILYCLFCVVVKRCLFCEQTA